MTKKVMVSIDEDVLKEFDQIIDLVPRSAYINKLMKQEVSRLRNFVDKHE